MIISNPEETAYECVKLSWVRPRFVFTHVFGISQCEQSRVEPALVLTLVEPRLVCVV